MKRSRQTRKKIDKVGTAQAGTSNMMANWARRRVRSSDEDEMLLITYNILIVM